MSASWDIFVTPVFHIRESNGPCVPPLRVYITLDPGCENDPLWEAARTVTDFSSLAYHSDFWSQCSWSLFVWRWFKTLMLLSVKHVVTQTWIVVSFLLETQADMRVFAWTVSELNWILTCMTVNTCMCFCETYNKYIIYMIFYSITLTADAAMIGVILWPSGQSINIAFWVHGNDQHPLWPAHCVSD